MGPKKMTKNERQRLTDEYEKMRKNRLEQERLKLLKEEKERIEKEKKMAQENIKREIIEQEMRQKELAVSCGFFSDLDRKMKELLKNTKEQNEWAQYLECNGLPDPNSLSQINTYLYLWKKDDSYSGMDKVLEKTNEVIKIRSDLRRAQQNRLDIATYNLLRNIDKNLQKVDLSTSKYTLDSQHFIMNIWSKTMLPVSSASATEVKQGFTLEFPDIGVSLFLPASLAGTNMAVRALWLKYDHISDNCRTWECPPLPDSLLKNLNDITLKEWDLKLKLQKQLDEYEESIENATSEELLINKPKKTISEMMTEMEEDQVKKWKEQMTVKSVAHEVNLRKFTFLGGVFYLDLLQQPSQPKELNNKCLVTLLSAPEGLNIIPYYEHYIPPPPPEPGAIRTPEEIETEMKKQEKALEKVAAVTVVDEPKELPAEYLKREMEKEKELQKLIVVTVDLPESVLWFEQPMAANWDPNNNYWSTEEIHDLKFNEDKQTLTFRTGRMGLIGLACYRYCNLPFQTWEMKPEVKNQEGGVLFNVTASVAIIEFLIREGEVSINLLQNGTSNALQEHVGIFYKPKKLIKILQNGGVDVFPPPDAFCYLDGVVMKHRAAENHLYHCMAVLSTSHNFSWSRWNMTAGRRNMILQMREFLDKKRPANYNILHVTPLKACLVDCTEVSANFNEEGIKGMKFYSDLYNLALNHSSKRAKQKIEMISFGLSETVYEMLCSVRPLCFS